MNIANILFGFEGRIRRTTFWLAHLGATIALSVVALVFVVIAAGLGAVAGSDESSGAVAMFVLWLIPLWLVAIWVSLAIGIKRCHDRDYPGAMILLALIPIFGALWMLIDLGFVDGTLGPNRFGSSPKGTFIPPAAPTIVGA